MVSYWETGGSELWMSQLMGDKGAGAMCLCAINLQIT